MPNYPITVIQSAWRRIRRPSPETLRQIRTAPVTRSSSVPSVPSVVKKCPPGGAWITKREIIKYASQNTALLTVLASHESGASNLSPTVLNVVRSALNSCGPTLPTDANHKA